MNNEQLKRESNDIKQWLIDVRRDFHKHPELGMEEYRTRDQIIRYLEEMGIPYEKDIANTAVVGLITGEKEGKTVALRADIDALPITEANDVPYKSVHKGKMHACGHDAHTTMLLGAAKVLQQNREHIRGQVKLFFQPAEETVGGAKPMIEEGVMEHPKVEAVFGIHVATDLPTGEVAVKYGQMNASSDTILLTVKGSRGHGAYPHSGKDAIVMAAQVITQLQTIVSRNVDPREAAVISIGQIEGGKQKNIIADDVHMVGTVRTFHPDVRDYVLKRIEEVLKYTTKSMGGDYVFERGTDGYAALINDDQMVDIVYESGKDLLGEDNVSIRKLANMGVEDFAYFAQAAPSAFFNVGCRNEEKGIVHGAHTEKFDIDEDCLPIGAMMQVKNVLAFLNRK
ncbi:MAG TPA: M20 family metallopeptidase [Bacillota bacterium]|nr:M20 family metallopeptidase [Bacillota bacterium]